MPVNGNVPVNRMRLPEDPEGAVDATVKEMVRIAFGQYGSRSPKVRALAHDIVRKAGVREKDYYGEVLAIHNWIKKNIRYFRDPINQETLSHPEELVFNSRGGDCLDEDTLLLASTGMVAIKNIRPGDTIWGKEGWTTVLQTWDKGILPTKAYRLNNGGEFIATDNHKCFRADGSEVPAKDLREGDLLLQPSCVRENTSCDLSLDDLTFMGYYLSDGWIDGNRICISGKDGNPKEEQKRWVAQYAELKGWATSWHPRYIRVYAPRDHIGKIDSACAIDKRVDGQLLHSLNEQQAHALLKGMLADSHQPKSRRSGLCFSTISREMALDVRILYRKLGLSCRITRVDKHGGLGEHPIYRVYPRIYKDRAARLEGIEEVGARHVYDIETEDHGIYLPEADVTVHNCDDMVVTEMALLGAVGIKSFPVVVGQRPGMYSHVYLKAIIPPGKHRKAGQVIALDPIMKNWNAGREAPARAIKSKKEYPQLEAEMLDGDQDLGDIYTGVDDGRSLGAYATGPSYLDDEYANVEQLLQTDKEVPDITHDLVMSTTPKATQSKEGVDGMFGLGLEPASDYQMTQPATIRQTGPRGPVTSEEASRTHRVLSRAHKRKRYEGNSLMSSVHRATGRNEVNQIDPNRKTVVAETNQSDKNRRSAAKAPLTPPERMAELDGLGELLYRAGRGITLGGLGADPAEAEATAEDIATASWWSLWKARLAAAREAYLESKLRQAQAQHDHCKSESLKTAKKVASAEKSKAVEVAKQAKAVEAEASKTPGAAKAMAETKQDLENAEAKDGATAAIDGLGWLGEDSGEKMPQTGQERASQVARNRCERVAKKVEKLRKRVQEAKSWRKKTKAKMAKRPIETPLNIKSVQKAGEHGKRAIPSANANGRSQGFKKAAPANEAAPREGVIVPQGYMSRGNADKRATEIPAGVNGLGNLPTVSMPFLPDTVRDIAENPAVQYGTAALIGFAILKRMKK